MMKKITAMLLALMLACLMSCACAADADPLYVGEWYLQTMADGEETMNVSAMGINGILTLNDDWTCSVTGLGENMTGTWKDENENITAVIGGDEVGIMLSNGELTLTAGTTTMIFTREAQAGKAPAIEVRADAAAEEFNGKWTCVALSMDGQTVDAATAKAIGQVLPDMDFDNGVIKMSGGPIAEIFSSLSKSLTYADGAYSLAADSGNVSITVNMLQDGTMSLTFAVGEQSTTLSFAKAE